MLPLRDVQARFLRSIAAAPGPSASRVFDPALLALVEGGGTLGPAGRLDVYAQMYWARLVDVLHDDFPRVAAVLGTDRFAALACAYLARHSSTNPSVRWVGAHFADFVATDGPVAGRPFLADLARLEWTRLAVFDAADMAPVRVEELRAVPPSAWPSLTFRPVPALRVLHLAWPVHELWAADDPTVAATSVRPAQTVLRVWRDGFDVYQTRADMVEHVALKRLLAGAPFASICGSLEAMLPPAGAAREAAALLLRWVEDGVLAPMIDRRAYSAPSSTRKHSRLRRG
jgi:hypothetical protein